MNLTIVTPTELLEEVEVDRVRAAGIEGSFTVLPRHIDVVTALVPGIISFVRSDDGDERFVAADEGLLVKRRDSVSISVLEGTRGVELERVREELEEQYTTRNERERRYRMSVTRMETELAKSFLEYQRES